QEAVMVCRCRPPPRPSLLKPSARLCAPKRLVERSISCMRPPPPIPPPWPWPRREQRTARSWSRNGRQQDGDDSAGGGIHLPEKISTAQQLCDRPSPKPDWRNG